MVGGCAWGRAAEGRPGRGVGRGGVGKGRRAGRVEGGGARGGGTHRAVRVDCRGGAVRIGRYAWAVTTVSRAGTGRPEGTAGPDGTGRAARDGREHPWDEPDVAARPAGHGRVRTYRARRVDRYRPVAAHSPSHRPPSGSCRPPRVGRQAPQAEPGRRAGWPRMCGPGVTDRPSPTGQLARAPRPPAPLTPDVRIRPDQGTRPPAGAAGVALVPRNARRRGRPREASSADDNAARRDTRARAPARSRRSFLGPVRHIPPCFRRLARTLTGLSGSTYWPRGVPYEDDPPPCDRTHQTTQAPPCGWTALCVGRALGAGLSEPE